MRAAAAVVAETGPGGTTRFPILRSDGPLVLRRTAGRTEGTVYLVGGAAGPIGGDVLSLRIEVRAGATLRLRTTAAAVALPARDGRESVLTVTASVAAGGRLEFLPEPTVAAAGARHRVELRFCLEAGAALVLRDELILGRHGERGGCCRTRLRVDLAGAPLLRHELAVCGEDGTSLGPAVLSGHRAAGCLLRAGPVADTAAADVAAGCPPCVAVMPLAGPAILVTALAHDAITLRERLTQPVGRGHLALPGEARHQGQASGG